MKRLLCLVLLILFLSCREKSNQLLKNDIDNGSKKYWRRYYTSIGKLSLTGYCFSSNGEYDQYYLKRGDNTRYISRNPEGIKRTWKLVNDSTILLANDYQFKIVKLDAKNFILKSLEKNDSGYFKLYHEEDQLSNLVEDTVKNYYIPGL